MSSTVPFDQIMASRVVTVFVGKAKAKWLVHESLLSETSDFFKSAFRGDFKEKNGVLELPEDDAAAFEIFARWLYTRAAALTPCARLPPIQNAAGVHGYLQLYVLATKYLIEELQNDVIDVIYTYFGPRGEPYPNLRDLRYVCDNTESRSPMRQLLAVKAAFQLFLTESRKMGHFQRSGWKF